MAIGVPTLRVSRGTKYFEGIQAEAGLSRRSPRELCSSGLEDAVTRGKQIK